MTTAVGRGLVQAQSARWTELDPLLPPAADPPDGDVITAALPDGRRVAGVLLHELLRPGAVARLWSASDSTELVPLLGDTGAAGMAALLQVWRRRLDRYPDPGPDSSGVVIWPSRDVASTRVLLDHGLQPLTVVAVRLPHPTGSPASGGSAGGSAGSAGFPAGGAASAGLTIRLATPRDLDVVLDLALAEQAYSAQVGATLLRPESAQVKRRALADRLRGGGLVWLAEQDGIAVALAECAISESNPDSWASSRLPAGRWGYVNCLSVLPGARGAGIGQRLMAFAHAEFRRLGVTRSYLYYNPPNPLSSVFWPRQGYRPLWTVWEVRPVGALR